MLLLGPDVWGPHGWKFIHYVTLGYPENPTLIDKKNYKNFFKLIGNVLPCGLCRNHYRNHLMEYPLSDKILDNKNKLIKWGINVHNAVNKENNSKEYSFKKGLKKIKEVDDTCVRENFENQEKNKSKKLKKGMLLLPIFIFSIILIFQSIKIFKKNNN